MSDLEKIEDMYPELRFWKIDVDDARYHGSIAGKDIYINRNQDDLDWLKTALHETSHYENDEGNLSNKKSKDTLIAEKWATYEANDKFKKIFG